MQEDVYSGHFRSDGRLLCVGSSRGFVQAIDVATKASLRKFQGHRGPVHVAQFSPDGGTHIVTAGDDRRCAARPRCPEASPFPHACIPPP